MFIELGLEDVALFMEVGFEDVGLFIEVSIEDVALFIKRSLELLALKSFLTEFFRFRALMEVGWEDKTLCFRLPGQLQQPSQDHRG